MTRSRVDDRRRTLPQAGRGGDKELRYLSIGTCYPAWHLELVYPSLGTLHPAPLGAARLGYLSLGILCPAPLRYLTSRSPGCLGA